MITCLISPSSAAHGIPIVKADSTGKQRWQNDEFVQSAKIEHSNDARQGFPAPVECRLNALVS
jgi:hypothetical protein